MTATIYREPLHETGAEPISPFLRDALIGCFHEAARALRTGPLGNEDRVRHLDQQARELEAGR